jgi:DNA-binding SARP family transcriptional activator/tetratricopeptide (TPR) repeat protein
VVELRVLGPVACYRDGVALDVGPRLQRCVLAVLVVEVDRVVSTDRMIECVWGERAPAKARAALQVHLSRLRRLFVPEDGLSIARRSGGYVLSTDPSRVDLHRFRELSHRAALVEDAARGAELTGEALRLWRADALEGLDSEWAETVREKLHDEHRATRCRHTDFRLACGQHAELVPELRSLSTAWPADEKVAGQLVLALYRSGRRGEALAHHERVRVWLREELGVDPGPELRQAQQEVLRGEAGRASVEQVLSRTAPRQLAAAPRWFTGRADELARLTAALVGGEGGDAPTRVAVVCGGGGVGKSWLALRWAHHNAGHFPDGQLQVSLRGFSATDEPMSAGTALRGLLTALGVAPASVPADVDVRAAVYRSLVADKRMLVVLDDARDAEQVRPLLPGAASCAVVVTSRNLLTDLVSGHGADLINLDVLTEDESRVLLRDRIGASAVAAEPAVTDEVLRYCAGLPLALSTVAARVTATPGLRLSDLVVELRDAASRLRALDGGGGASSTVTSVFSASCAALREETAVLFTALGSAPGQHVDLHVAASLTAAALNTTRLRLAELAEANLLTRTGRDRWHVHDLLKLFALHHGRQQTSPEERTAALRRLVDFYRCTAIAAAHHLNPHRPALPRHEPVAGCAPRTMADAATALAWFDTEYHDLMAVQKLAAQQRWHAEVWQLAWALTPIQRWYGHHADNVTVWRLGLRAAQQGGDPVVRGRAHRWLGHAHARAAQYPAAHEHLDHALRLAQDTGQLVDLAYARHATALAHGWQGDDTAALRHATAALELFETIANPVWEAEALNTAGWYHARLGQYDHAHRRCRRALRLDRRHRYRDGEAHALDSLGHIAQLRDDHDAALQHHYEALRIRTDLRDHYGVATTLVKLGEAHTALGDTDTARTLWQRALTLHRARHCTVEAHQVERALAQLPPPSDGTHHTSPRGTPALPAAPHPGRAAEQESRNPPARTRS